VVERGGRCVSGSFGYSGKRGEARDLLSALQGQGGTKGSKGKEGKRLSSGKRLGGDVIQGREKAISMSKITRDQRTDYILEKETRASPGLVVDSRP